MCNTNEEALVATAENENIANATDITPVEVRNDIYWDRNGKEIHRTPNDLPKDRTFIVKTSDSRNTIYRLYINKNESMCALVQNISPNIAKETENQIKEGNVDPNNPNIVEIVNMDILFQMLKVVKNDNGEGGVSDSNNREYGGTFNKNDDNIASILQGKVGNPETDPYAFIEFTTSYNTRCTFHSHPSGERGERRHLENNAGTLSSGGSYNWWQQPPSSVDTQDIRTTDYVFAMQEKRVYVYDSGGVLAHFPQSVINGFYEKKQKAQRDELKKSQNEEKNLPANKTKDGKKALKEKHNKENADLKRQQELENATISIP